MIKPIATKEERIRLIKECQQSGLTINEWCRRNGIQRNTFHTWMTRARKKGLIETPATVPTVVAAEASLPDIVKVSLANETDSVVSSAMPLVREDDRKQCSEYQVSSKSAVMELVIGSIRIKVTNQVKESRRGFRLCWQSTMTPQVNSVECETVGSPH